MRTKGTNEDFWIETAQIINRLAKDSQFIVQLHNVQIPFSFYQLSATSNLNRLPIYIRNPVDGAGIYTTVIIPEGNYTPYTLITALNTVLTTACQTPALGFTPFTPVFNTSYNSTNGKITFALTSPVGCQITLRFSVNNLTGLLGNFFGMGGVDVAMTTSSTVLSVQPCVLNPVNYLCIRSSLKQFRNREFIVIKDDVSDILAKVPILTQQGTYVQWIEQSEPIYIIDNSINTIEFYLTNNLTYDPINLQNLSWSFTFSISEVLRPDYASIATTQAINMLARQIAPADDEKFKQLEQQKKELVDKLAVYQKKLEGKPTEPLKKDEKKVEEEKKAEEKKDVSKYSAVFDASSKLTEFQPIVYKNMFEDEDGEPPQPTEEVPPEEEKKPEENQNKKV